METIILTILSLAVLAGGYSLWRLHDSISSYSKGFGAEAGKIDAAAKKLDEIELQLKRTTQLTESIKSKISSEAERSRVRREKIEELCSSINLPIELLIASVKGVGEKNILALTPERVIEIEQSIMKSKVVCMLYFQDLSSNVNEFVYSTQMVLDKFRSNRGPYTMDEITDVLEKGKLINMQLMKIASENL